VTALGRLGATLALVLAGCAGVGAQSVLRWAGDAEGGAPYVEADPANPSRVAGFEVDVATLIAQGLGREAQFIQIEFASIDQSIARGDADIGLNGIEDTPTRRATLAVTLPYFEFREVLSVRTADAGRFHTLANLGGRRVGTLGGTIAYDILLRAERDHGIIAVSYDDDVHPYSDLLLGRLDAVLLDNVLADRRRRAMPGFSTQPGAVAVSHYIGVLSPQNTALRDRVNDILKQAMRDGRLEGILRKWQVWNDDQPQLFARVLRGEPVAPIVGYEGDNVVTLSKWEASKRYLPSLLRASGATLVFSCVSMLLAVGLVVWEFVDAGIMSRVTYGMSKTEVESILGPSTRTGIVVETQTSIDLWQTDDSVAVVGYDTDGKVNFKEYTSYELIPTLIRRLKSMLGIRPGGLGNRTVMWPQK
jgi:polar amino acid transport system substrate-binding protein